MQWEKETGGEIPIEEFVALVHEKLLDKFYDLAQRDTKLSFFMIPVMAHLRKMPIPDDLPLVVKGKEAN